MPEIATAHVTVRSPQKWRVALTRGEVIEVVATDCNVTDHGHLIFPDGSLVARQEWQYVTKVDERGDLTEAAVDAAADNFYPESPLAPENEERAHIFGLGARWALGLASQKN